MEVKKTVTSLTSDSVSILEQTFEKNENGDLEQVGLNHRIAYANSVSGRASLADNETEEIVAAVYEAWGDEPTVNEPKLPEYVPDESGGYVTADEIWDEMALAIEEGVNEV